MKRKPAAELTSFDGPNPCDAKRKKNSVRGDSTDEAEEEEHLPILELDADGDVCRALMKRYARSSAQQHRHLCAIAGAMRSILSEEGFPLTPVAYFAASIRAVQDADWTDVESAASLSAFLAVVLPLVPSDSLSMGKAKEAGLVIDSILRDFAGDLSTGTLRSMVKSLGLVLLRVDLEDWNSVEMSLETLLLFAIDKRPKVRRCAQSFLETLFKNLQNSSIAKKASKAVLLMHRKHITLVRNGNSSDADVSHSEIKPENLEALHMLNLLNAMLPYLSDKSRKKILSDSYKLLGCYFSWSTRHIIRTLEAILEQTNAEIIADKAEQVVSVLTDYVSNAEKNPTDTIISALTLLKSILKKFRDSLPNMWIKYLPLIFTSLIGYLRSDSHMSKNVGDILKELLTFNINQSLFKFDSCKSGNNEMSSSPEMAAVSTICHESYEMLKSSSFPTEHLLQVTSVLFLQLGESSFVFMKEILIRLSQFAITLDEENPNLKHLEQCIGAAVFSMGPERLLSLIPITIDMEKANFSNSWIIPILKKFVFGASLQYFMDNIVPMANCIHEASRKFKKDSIRKSLLSCYHNLWDLLPSFCRHSIDMPEKIESLSLLFVAVLKKEQFLHETVALALQVLVYSNREDDQYSIEEPSSIFSQHFNVEFRNFHFSKDAASENMKALASISTELFQILKDLYFNTSYKRGCIKDALGSLILAIPSEYIIKFLLSEMKNIEKVINFADSENINDPSHVKNKNADEKNPILKKINQRRCLLMELLSSFVEAADTDLTNTIFDFIKSTLSDGNGVCQCEAYSTLSRILKEKVSFCSVQLDEVIELLFTVKPPADVSSLKNRFSCFDFLLVYILKSNVADMNTKAFLILNEIILTLKTKKESRKLAYDSLLVISMELKAHPDSTDSDILHLFNMVMGYLSSSSPHIMSGAVSALSLLIYHDASFCLSVPSLIPSVLLLLQNKAPEVIKATLGFIKVLVSSLNCNDLMKLLPEILQGLLPWSSVSKFHFKSKVGIILEILLRKCGSEAVEILTPDKYKTFVKSIKEGRTNRKLAKGSNISTENSTDLIKTGGKKTLLDNHVNSSEETWKKSTPILHKIATNKSKNGLSKRKCYNKVISNGPRNHSARAFHSKKWRTNYSNTNHKVSLINKLGKTVSR